MASQVSQAILDQNTNAPNNLAGPQGTPYDLTAQNNNSGVSVPAVSGGYDYSNLERKVFHDNDSSGVGFINYTVPVAGGQPTIIVGYPFFLSVDVTTPGVGGMSQPA